MRSQSRALCNEIRTTWEIQCVDYNLYLKMVNEISQKRGFSLTTRIEIGKEDLPKSSP